MQLTVALCAVSPKTVLSEGASLPALVKSGLRGPCSRGAGGGPGAPLRKAIDERAELVPVRAHRGPRRLRPDRLQARPGADGGRRLGAGLLARGGDQPLGARG